MQITITSTIEGTETRSVAALNEKQRKDREDFLWSKAVILCQFGELFKRLSD